MATLTAGFQFDIDILNLNQWVSEFVSHILYQNLNDPYEDTYTIFADNDDQAISLFGSSFGYGGAADMVRGTVEAMSQFFWDGDGYVEAFHLSDLDVASRKIYDAMQTASTDDDFALLENILSGKDMFALSAFNDTVHGYDGADRIYGFGGNDMLHGDDGRDKLFGGTGNDKLVGGDNKDKLAGGKDNDVLRGGEGNDILRGGAGRDKVFGGDGEDVFMFATGDDIDIIKGFESVFMAHDVIDLSGLASVKGWNDLMNNHMTQDGKDVVIDGGDGDMLILRHTDIDHLSKAFFEF